MLHSSVEQMDLRILTKQFLLASNLLRDYVSEVREESWEQLWTALRSQSALIANLIQSSDRPQAKIKALNAFEDLNEALFTHIDSTPQAKSA